MTIEKGAPWGEPGALPADGVVVRTDAAGGEAIAAARSAGRPLPVLGLLGGDLCRTLGGHGDEARLRSGRAVTFPVDLGTANGHVFVAHAIARNRRWTRVVAVLNAQWLGRWNAGPRAHPNDGLLDIYDARLGVGDLWKVRARLPDGAHLPHPAITERRRPAADFTFERPLGLWLDGIAVGPVSELHVTVEPDALTVVI